MYQSARNIWADFSTPLRAADQLGDRVFFIGVHLKSLLRLREFI